MRIRQALALNKGYTLIEAVLALAGLSILLSLTPLVMDAVKGSNGHQKLNPHEVELFFTQTNMEVRDSIELEVRQGVLFLKKPNGEEVSYEHYNNLILRQVDNSGYEPLLQQIQSVNYYVLNEGSGVKISVTGPEGSRYERIFSLFTKSVSSPL